MAEKKGGCLTTIAALFVLGSIGNVILLIAGKASELELESPFSRFIVCCGLFACALVYVELSDTGWKVAFGLIEMGAAFLSNWHQLSQLGRIGLQPQLYDRLAFIAGGIVLIAHGWKDASEGLNKKKDQQANALDVAGNRRQ